MAHDLQNNFQTIDSSAAGAFDIKHLSKRNDGNSTLQLPGIGDHRRNATSQLTDFGATIEPDGFPKKKKRGKSNVVMDNE